MSFLKEVFDPRSPSSFLRFQEPVQALATEALSIDLSRLAEAPQEREVDGTLGLRTVELLERTHELLDAILSSCEETIPLLKRPASEERASPRPRELGPLAFIAHVEVEGHLELARSRGGTRLTLNECVSALSLILSALRAVDAAIARAAAIERLLDPRAALRASAELDSSR